MSSVIEPIDLAAIPENAALERVTAAQIKARFPLLTGKKKGTRTGDTKPLRSARSSLAPAHRPMPLTALQKACETVASAKEGQRNDALYRQAFFVAQRLAGGLLDESESQARQALRDAARQAGLEEGEIAATLDSAFKSGLAAPVQSYELAGGRIEYSTFSVWFYPAPKKEGDAPAPLLLARQLEVAARTYDTETGKYGFRLCGKTDKGRAIDLILPARICTDGGNAVAAELADAGFQIEPLRKQKELLAAHLLKCPVDAEQRLSSRLGWHGDTYLLPDKAIAPEGSDSEPLIYHSNSTAQAGYGTAGTLDEWRQQIAAPARGNTRLMLALSAAFAAPLLKPYGIDRGGFLVHLRGDSSSGKTTALNLAASVFGKPSAFTIQWRATANALEGIAESRNDGLLALDEVGQATAKELEPLAYMLANGRGKERKSKNVDNRTSHHWRTIGLSTGERSYGDIIGEDGNKRARAGQELRFLDVPPPQGKQGLFDGLNGHASGADLAQHLNASANRYHGAAGEAFLQQVANEYGQLEGDIPAAVKAFVRQVTPAGASGQAERAAAHFGLLAAAGELATEHGITGWQQGEATDAIATCFAAWLEGFGTGNREQQQALNDMRTFLMANAHCAFIEWGTKPLHGVHNLVGHWQEAGDGDRHFIIHTKQFSRICKGHNPNNALKALEASGILVRDKKGDLSHAQKLGGKTQRFYLLSWHALGIAVPTAEIGSRFTPDHADNEPANEPVTAAAKAYAARKSAPVKASHAATQRPPAANKTAAHIALAAQQPLKPVATVAGALHSSRQSATREPPASAGRDKSADSVPLELELKEQERQQMMQQMLADAARAEVAHGEY